SAGAANEKVTGSARARVERLETLAREEHGFEPSRYHRRWRHQLGSLGSGKRFIEVCLDEQDRVWLFLHSGSGGGGNKIDQHHIHVSEQLMRSVVVPVPARALAYLAEGTEAFDRYTAEMTWAQEYARENRAEMMDRVVAAVERFVDAPVERLQEASCHHNYTTPEHQHVRS